MSDQPAGTVQRSLRELLASVVVFLVALPLCMGIAIASGVPPVMGLVSGIIGGLVIGFIAGSPLQVSGPAAGLAVIVFEIVQTHGIEALGPIALVAGMLQFAAGRLKFGQWFRAVAPAVIYAMLAGIGILIFSSQFHVMVDDVPNSNGLTNFLTIPWAIWKGVSPVEGTPHHLAAGVGLLTLVVLVSWNWLRTKLPGALAVLPAPLLAVGAGVAVAAGFNLPIAYVDMPDGVSNLFMFPTLDGMSMLLNPAVLGSAVALAAIASAESLLCAMATDKLHDGVRSDLDKELSAQGVGNMVAGLIGGLPVTGVIVRSTANIQSGATTRWSAVLHGGWLLIAVAAVPFLLEKVPVASLAAILVYIGFKLVNREVPKKLLARGKGELAIYLVTVFAIVATNLLSGLIIGFVLSVAKMAWGFSHIDIEVTPSGDRLDVDMHGSATFMSLPALARQLEALPEGKEVHLHLEHLGHVDHACFELIADWRKNYEGANGTVVMELSELHLRGATPRENREEQLAS